MSVTLDPFFEKQKERIATRDFKPMFSSNKQDWGTPPELYEKLDRLFHFTLDVCANAENHKAPRWFGHQVDGTFIDGLKECWNGETCFMNPPYKYAEQWMKKAYEQRIHATTVALVPARTDTKWFWNYGRWADETVILKGRLKFVGADSSAPFPSLLLIFKVWPRGILSYWDWKNETCHSRS